MELDINWLAVALATVASMIVAGVWYQDFAFGMPWKKLTKIDAKRAEKAGNTPMVVVLVVNFFTAVVLAAAIFIVATHSGNSSVWLALATSVVIWLAFSATTLLTHNMFEQKPLKLTAINNGYQLAMFTVMALIIGVM
jgi:CBS domain containing-hemolysin-like protein